MIYPIHFIQIIEKAIDTAAVNDHNPDINPL